ncbi:hypothetical protein [Motiliproteus sp. SC1-56]|uniref:hypothetical protein n=1 Tax=Motiliproteus sp. SC1-56 TaxID=2799565 RepID=UPI001A8F432C|nr:hypothetical protein [Motiliproteus sp. SC1-56]
MANQINKLESHAKRGFVSDWTSLDVAKLVVQAAVPAVLAIIGFAIKSELQRRENNEWRTRIQVEWRLRVFEEMAKDLNNLYCAFNYIGNWGSMEPPVLLDLKRNLDRNFYIYKFLWSEQFRESYARLINACFVTNRGAGLAAASRANVSMYKKAWGDNWKPSWDEMFVSNTQRLRRDEFNELYADTSARLITELGIDSS